MPDPIENVDGAERNACDSKLLENRFLLRQIRRERIARSADIRARFDARRP